MADTNVDFSTKYSLSSLLNNLLRLNQNSMEIMNKLSDITTSNADQVEIDVIDANNTIRKVYVPSYGQIKSEISRLDNNIKQLAGVGDSNANIQLEDGSFRKLMLSNLKLEGNTISNMTSPTAFESKSNWFFESFLNPLLYVSFDFTGQIPTDTERCKVQRFILNIDNQSKRNVWTNSIAGKSNLDYVKFFQLLLKHNITYFLDEDIVDMPPRELRYFGNFKVLGITDSDVVDQVDGVNWTKRKFQIQLNTLNYNDSLSEYSKTQQLKIGDSIVITGDGTNNNTKYQIINIDLDSGDTIEMKLIEGFDLLSIGSTLSYFSAQSADLNLDVNIGFNEYSVVFVKPINPVSKIPALEWSPGSAFYTNSLQILDEAGNQVTLEEYYKEQVVDFGNYLYNMAKDGIPPATLAQTPDVPKIESDDFTVAQINQHITDVARIDKIKKLQTEKISIQSKLNSLNSSISKKRADMNTKRYTSQSDRDTDQNELTDLIKRSSTNATLLKSAVDEIISLAEADNLEGITPKFRVKGFWPMPDPVASTRTGAQSVIQFKIQYRYVSKDGGSNQPQQITFKDNNGSQRRGTFSTWEEILTPVRQRFKNPTTGQFEWATERVEDADSININQTEIPIKQGEGIEIRMKSISEAGWPTNPAESDWTGTVRIDFPDDLVSSNEITTIIEQARLSAESLELTNTLNESGVTEHISAQFTQNETFYAHPSTMIASGFLTDEQNVINLFEKLTNFETRIKQIEEAITGEKGKLGLVILDANGNNYNVKNNSLVQLFAGNYRDQVSGMDVQKGVIISKTYLLQLSNVNASPLELYSREYGNYLTTTTASWDNTGAPWNITGSTAYVANDSDYNTTRRYDFVPVGPQNPNANLVNDATYLQFVDLPSQSAQVKGQFINTRYMSVDGTAPLYENINNTLGVPTATFPQDTINNTPPVGTDLLNYADHEFVLSSYYGFASPFAAAAGNVAGDFIWSGTFNGNTPETVNVATVTAQPNGWNDGIFIHNLHPLIRGGVGPWGTVSTISGPGATGAAGPTGVRNSVFSPLQSTDLTSGSRIQAAYTVFNSGFSPKAANLSKMAFNANDQYLIGPNSVGCYLYLSPQNTDGDINVDGANQLSTKTLDFGTKNAINIPIVFQYRMTDFYGDQAAGIGNIGGDASGVTNQVEYIKRLGLDIYSNTDERFSFDVEITARYRSKSLQLEEVPAQTMTSVVDDLTRTVRILNPQVSGISEESSNRNSGNLLGSIS